MRRYLMMLTMLLIGWPAASVGQTEVTAGDTVFIQQDGYLLTDAQFSDMAAAVDSLDAIRQLWRAERSLRRKWRGNYVTLDSLYRERDELGGPEDFALRDAGFWGVLGVALGVSLDDLLED